MKKGESIKRRTRIGIVTNKMSDEVYSVLVQKGEKNELTQYVIGLVENDLNEKQLQNQVITLEKHFENLNQIIVQIEKKLESLDATISLILKNQDLKIPLQ
ncbi:hypothetical protein [Heyndrickxia ginsengihumi]|uniref:hypothetical protein n=1 Tax=Heyndrickxia ginsengihumi TaxID=363870 RepID=UPI0012DFB8AA|nr:hypothetical protein [Heyndrickxia ginsengihumi]